MDLLCVGHAAWDISVFVPEYPAENSKSEVRTMIECGGGPAANAAFLLSRWGVSCALAAVVGDDAYGERIVREFTAIGTDLELLQHDPEGSTPVSGDPREPADGQPDDRQSKVGRDTIPTAVAGHARMERAAAGLAVRRA